MLLGIVIVEYKSPDKTIEFVRHLCSNIDVPYVLAIVSNSATEADTLKISKGTGSAILRISKDEVSDYNLEDIENELSQERPEDCVGERKIVLGAEENLGFAKGNNLGAAYLLRRYKCDMLLFSNNDIRVEAPDVISALIKKMEACKDIGMIGPEIVGLDGKRQSPEPFVTIWDRYVGMHLATLYRSRAYKIRRYGLDYSERAAEGAHFRIMGSFFLMSSRAFVDINGFDPSTFLYAEEMILAKRLELEGYKVYFYPQVRVIHEHELTTSQHLARTKKRSLQRQSENYYYHKYCNVPKWKVSLYSAMNSIINSIIETIGSLRKR